MKFPRTFLAVTALCVAAAIASSCGSSPSSHFSSGGGGGGGSTVPPTGTNYTTCTDSFGNTQLVPNWESQLFISNYQPAIQAMLAHYSGQLNGGYVRIGLGRGGEINLPQDWNQSSSGACSGGYTTKWGYSISNWSTYLQSMISYEAGLGASEPLLVSITPVSGDSGNVVVDAVSQAAVNSGISFGNQGLEASDLSGSCGGNWCNLFQQFPASPSSPIRELQTLGQSCPEGASCANSLASSTGPLDPLLPFAIASGANDLELYYQDWLVAYDSSYASSVGATLASAAYVTAIQTATSGASMQVLFPPQAGTTDYSAVQSTLMSNPVVTGAVISVNWSDIEPNTAGTFDFTITDNAIAPWIAAGKKVNLVLESSTYGGNACGVNGPIGSNGMQNTGNCAMPSWMWTVLK